MIQAFTYSFQLYDQDIQNITDQNVYSYEFRNLGDVPVWINNQLYLPGMTVSPTMSIFNENMAENEKTKSQYSIRFETDTDFDLKKLLVIQKIPST